MTTKSADSTPTEKSASTTTTAAPPQSTSSPSLAKLLSLSRPEWPMLFVSLIFMIVSEGIVIFTPIIIADAYDAIVTPPDNSSNTTVMQEINKAMSLALIVFTVAVVTSFLRHLIQTTAGERLVARLRNNLYIAILKQEIAFFDTHTSGELVSRLGSDTVLLQQGAVTALPEIVLGVIKLCVSIALMFWISPRLAGVTIAFVAAIFGTATPIGKYIGVVSKKYQDVLGLAQTHSTEALGSIRTVQSFAAELKEINRYQMYIGVPDLYKYWLPNREDNTTYKFGIVKALLNTALMSIIFGVGFGSLYLLLWYGFKLVVAGDISLGELTAFQTYVFQIGGTLGSISSYISKYFEALGASVRVFYLLERVPEIPKQQKEVTKTIVDEERGADGTVKPETMKGAVDINNVSFSYPSRVDMTVLDRVSLSIPANTTTALVGSSGSGKSTIVALLQRFYDVTDGSITIDGNDVRSLDLQWLRQNVGYVQQEPQLFGLSVRDNVTYGVSRIVPPDQIEAACRMANAHDFIESFPEKYDTLVGERGVQLSGGQKQRIAIARALLVNPRILLLDEATSALDAESEYLVQQAIDNAVVGRTVIIVAHRLSTIMNATQIAVLDNHRVVDTGTHRELLDRCTIYQDLIKRQSAVAE